MRTEHNRVVTVLAYALTTLVVLMWSTGSSADTATEKAGRGLAAITTPFLELPGNIVDILFSTGGYVSESDKAAIMKELGIDRPIWVQYVDWLREILTGDLGKSYRYDLPAWQVIKPLIPVTVELAVLSTLIAIALGVPTGVISAIKQDSMLDYVLRVISLAGLSMPSFWLGMVIILGLVTWFAWIPPLTYVSPGENFKLSFQIQQAGQVFEFHGMFPQKGDGGIIDILGGQTEMHPFPYVRRATACFLQFCLEKVLDGLHIMIGDLFSLFNF